jgi:hypothetical protein
MKRHLNFTSLASAACVLLAATAASQAQAQVTIDQNKAMSGGVSRGDAPGFPITLSAPGSYKLMSNLSVPMGTTGIAITASGVSLDLNGFGIYSVTNSCNGAGATLQCMVTSGADNGIEASAGVTDTRVQNGSIGFFGGAALKLNERSMVMRLRAFTNGGIGVSVGADSLVAEVSAYRSASHGISALNGALIVDSQADGNAKNGVQVGLGVLGGLVVNSRAGGNGKDGMHSFSTYTNFANNIVDGPAAIISGGLQTAGNFCNGTPC